ncbi:DUF4350 domain-containing protein [Curtobacterium sp. 9128]|uniref:DUF4350 domain-containing protein n=1 Tax=Curtobacterium sp. 9128 TaxID=1793722 RepID=UPI0011A5110C|nr:DUF4350 domain-containing protein [Curtobacterium sp. 9128]
MSATTVGPGVRETAAPDRDGRGARIVFWVAVVAVGVLLAVLTAAIGSRSGPTNDPLDPTSPTASGSKALVRVLEQQGTDVDVVHDVHRIGTGTVFVDDSAGVLAPSAARRIARTVPDAVLVTQDPAVLEAFGLDVQPAAAIESTATVSTASCAVPAARAAGRVSAAGTGYTAPASAGSRCAPVGTGADRTWGLVATATDAGTVTLVGTTAAFRNDTITTAGNAALALGLLGGTDHLTWYVPTAGTADAAPTLGSLAPPWVPGAIGLLALVAVAAGVWRGRRLGPLVVEQLPVVVRASETTEGRARLYARTRDRTHTLDTLRLAAIRRIGRALGLPRSAHVDEVVRRAAAVTGRPATHVGAVLVGGPTTDHRALVDGAAAVDDLERAVTSAVSGAAPRASRPEAPPAGPTRADRAPAPTDDPRPGGRP